MLHCVTFFLLHFVTFCIFKQINNYHMEWIVVEHANWLVDDKSQLIVSLFLMKTKNSDVFERLRSYADEPSQTTCRFLMSLRGAD